MKTPIGWAAGNQETPKSYKAPIGGATGYQKTRKTQKTFIGLATGYQKKPRNPETPKTQSKSPVGRLHCFERDLFG